MAGDDKKKRIIEAAGEEFLRNGLRGTSMEAIARAAQIAKPTLYAYFPDKQAVFRNLAESLIGKWRVAFAEGLRGPGGVSARIAAALSNKEKAVMRVLMGSPHADELYGARERSAAQMFGAFDSEILAAIERELLLAGVPRARLIAQLLLAACSGIVRKAQSPAELGPAIRLLSERLIEPELTAKETA